MGAILRSAAAFGVEKVYLTGFTECPPRKEILKVSLGGEMLVAWEKAELRNAIEECRREGYQIAALETGEGAVAINSIKSPKIALILGNEVTGLGVEELAQTDIKIEIPMEAKRSLNVSVAAGVAMFYFSSLEK